MNDSKYILIYLYVTYIIGKFARINFMGCVRRFPPRLQSLAEFTAFLP